MTLKQRIRFLTDGLARGAWLSFQDFRERMPGVSYDSIASALGQMYRSEQLLRRGDRKSYQYRSGPRPVLKKARGRIPRSAAALGFMALARLEKTDPAAYAKAVAEAERRRG